MNKNKYVMGIDVGGSHITASEFLAATLPLYRSSLRSGLFIAIGFMYKVLRLENKPLFNKPDSSTYGILTFISKKHLYDEEYFDLV
jgi:hypothetical protein